MKTTFIKVSKNYDSTFLEKPDVKFDDFIIVFKDKVDGWYLDWAYHLNKEEHAGFAALHLGFSYFEALSIYKNGSQVPSGEGFRNEIRRIFEDDLISAGFNDTQIIKAIKFLGTEGRNGFFHSGMSRKGIALEDGVPTIRIKPEDIDANGKITKVRIDRHTFMDRIRKDFELYVDIIKNPINTTERENFRNSWNEINLIPIPSGI